MRIFIDIETQPTTDPAVIAEIRSSIKPPANYSKPESIAAWLADKGETAALDAISKTALSPEDGSIISVCVARDDGEPTVIMRAPEDESDKALLLEFFMYVDGLLADATTISPTTGEALYFPEPYFIGHNVAFDLGWLWKRSAIQGLAPPFPIPAPDEIRHGKNCFCTMTAWAGHRGTISLSRLCRVLGIEDPKANEAGISGSNAWEFWRRGGLNTVDAYNRGA